MVKIRHTGFLKLNLKLSKKMHFRFLPKFSQALDEVSKSLGPQGVSKCEKNQIYCTLMSIVQCPLERACNSCDILNQHEQGSKQQQGRY
jgi:hypothetical protein